jgi:ClpP class serine protease
MAYSRLAARLYGAPLLITPEKAKILEEVFRAHLVGTAPKLRAMDDDYGSESEEQRAARVHQERVQRYAGIALQRRDDKPYALTQSGIALIPAMGTLIQRGSWMDSISGLTSYDMLASLLDKSMADPDVRGALFEYDTPGGEVPGAFEFQARVAAAASRKPVWAHANEMALSAGYLLMSGAERAYVAKTGMVGSIGVVMLHVDQSKRDAQMGYAYTFIYAGRSQGRRQLARAARAARQGLGAG